MIFVSQRLAPNQGLFAGLFIAIIFLVTNGQAEPPRSICSEIRTEGTCVASSQDGFKCAWTGETHILQPDALTPDRGLCIQDIQARADDGVTAVSSTGPRLRTILQQTPEAAAFFSWVTHDELLEVMKRGPLTIFAPTNAAMHTVATDLAAEGVLASKDRRQSILLDHVVRGFLPEAALVDGTAVETMGGMLLHIRRKRVDGETKVSVGGAQIESSSRSAANGILYVVEEPLSEVMPATAMVSQRDASRLSSSCRTLVESVEKACADDMCGLCHTAMCTASQAFLCHDQQLEDISETFLSATWGKFPVCRKACGDLQTSVSTLLKEGMLQPGDATTILRQHIATREKTAFTQQPRMFVHKSEANVLCDFRQPCEDAPTPDGYKCKDQLVWGKCGTVWMLEGLFCQRTCGTCYAQCLSLPVGSQCSTTNVRESIAVPCAAGLTCSIFNEGDLTRDIPALGICISTEVALKQAQEPAKAPIEAQAPSRGNGQEQPPRAEASEDESGEMLRDRAARETASPGEAMSALEGGAEGDEHRDERDLGVGEGGAEKVGEVTEAVPSPWSMSGPCENTGDCCAPARCSRSGSQMWCVLPGGALGSLRSAGCE